MRGPPDANRSHDFELSPLATVAAGFGLGIVLAGPRPASPPGPLLPLICAACLLLGLLVLRAGRRRLSFLLALGGFLTAGTVAAQLFEFRFPPDHVSRLSDRGSQRGPLRLEGRVVSTPLQSPFGLQFDLDVRSVETGGRFRPASGKIRLRLQVPADTESIAAVESLRFRFGDSIRALAQLRRPRVYQNPGTFDFRRWLESMEDIYWTGTIKSPLLVEKLAVEGRLRSTALLEKVRRRFLHAIDQLYPPWSVKSRNGAVLKAVLFGDRSSIDSETVENFRKAGLYHLLVIAGLHVGLLAMLVGFFLRLLRIRESWRPVLVLVFLFGYSLLVEQRAPTLRATLMISAYLVSRILYRSHSALNAIGLAAIILLLDRPPWLFESGFQLSFAAALLIVGLAGPVLERTTEPYRRALWAIEQVDLDPSFEPHLAQFRLDLRSLASGLKSRLSFLGRHPTLATATVTGPARGGLWAANMFLFSAVLQLGLLLPMAETFHRVSFSGIGLNALAIPVMTLLLGLALPCVVLSAAVPSLAPALAKVLSPEMAALFALTDTPHMPPWLSYRVPAPPSWVAWGFAISILVAAWCLGRHARLFWAGVSALGVFIVLISLYPFAPRLPRGLLEVTALDCGGGDAAFVVLPDRTSLLIDACGSGARFPRDGMLRARRWNPGEDVVSPYLWSRGVRKLDVLVATDSRDPQLPSIEAVAENFQVGEFWYASNSSSRGLEEFLGQVRRSGATLRPVTAGLEIARSEAAIQILWPPLADSNEVGASWLRGGGDPMALRITAANSSAIWLGNVSGRVEEELARSGIPLESQILKLARHGAKSSTVPRFLERARPQVALISAGGNPSVVPKQDTLDRLQALGVLVFRTDLDGAITVGLGASSIAIHTYRTSAADGIGGLGGGAIPRVR